MPDTSLGITYPASTAHTRLWEHFQELATDVNTIFGNRTPLRATGQLSSLYTLTATMTDLTGASVSISTPTAGALFLCSFSGDYQLVTAGTLTGVTQLVIDGVAATSQAIWSPANVSSGARATVGSAVTGVLAASGSHTFKLQANAVITSGSARLNSLHTQLSVLVLPL